ncbi:MAG TPA: hypothetical protein VF796_02900 [Humisphaera sp.]
MATDAVVGARDVLAALAEVRRAGSRRAWSALEAAEPDLAEFALEEVTAVHHQLLATAATPRQVRRLTRRVQRLALVLTTALRRARLRLWRDAGDGLPRGGSGDPASPHASEQGEGNPTEGDHG